MASISAVGGASRRAPGALGRWSRARAQGGVYDGPSALATAKLTAKSANRRARLRTPAARIPCTATIADAYGRSKIN